MPNARKGQIFGGTALCPHSATVDPVDGSEPDWKIAGRAVAIVTEVPGGAGDRFRADIAEVVYTHLNEQATLLVIDWWTPEHGLRRVERE